METMEFTRRLSGFNTAAWNPISILATDDYSSAILRYESYGTTYPCTSTQAEIRDFFESSRGKTSKEYYYAKKQRGSDQLSVCNALEDESKCLCFRAWFTS